MRFRSVILSLAALTASVFSAAAADMPSKAAAVNNSFASAAPQWAGFYVGVEGGYGLGHSKLDATGTPLASFDQSGGIFGARFGYNWQPNSWMVVGLVVDGDYTGNVKDTVSGVTSKFNWMSTVRGRAGLLLNPNTLLYGTGGLAFAKGNLTAGPISLDDVRLGYVVGAGSEYRFNQHWSVFLEWKWANFDRNTQFVVLNERSDIHTFMGGINFKFH